MERKPSGTGFQERRERDRSGASEAARRKPLPPEKTHAEEFYYQKQMTSRSGVIVTLSDGETVRGIIEWYDRECIKLHRDDGPNLLIYKRWIKYIGKDPATP
ncbi:MAG: hypothetical protein U0V87_15390 [Acidobacteriota bacterium]